MKTSESPRDVRLSKGEPNSLWRRRLGDVVPGRRHWSLKKFLWANTPYEIRSLILDRWVDVPQPRQRRANVVLSFLSEAGPGADGKISARRFLPAFCGALRRSSLATYFVSSDKQLRRTMAAATPTILINVFGEDHRDISNFQIDALERKAISVFNSSRIGPLLADKLASHQTFEASGVPVPTLVDRGGFIRERTGTNRPTYTDWENGNVPVGTDTHIHTHFVDTRVEFESRRYFTTVRLLCVSNTVLHAYPRARDDHDGIASVHAHDTPTDAALIEHLHSVLVATRFEEFSRIAQQLFTVLGDGFYCHDLLIDRMTGSVYVCESGFKFDDPAYWRHLEPLAPEIPSQSRLFPVEAFARLSAEAFLIRCEAILAGQSHVPHSI